MTTNKNYHTGQLVRIPRDLIDRLRASAKAGNRPISRELAAALEAHFGTTAKKTARKKA